MLTEQHQDTEEESEEAESFDLKGLGLSNPADDTHIALMGLAYLAVGLFMMAIALGSVILVAKAFGWMS